MRTEESPVKFPERLYVGFNMRRENDEMVRLGFATPCAYSNAKAEQTAWEKRKATVDKWSDYQFQADGSIKFHKRESVYKGSKWTIKETNKILTEADPEHPIYIDNNPIEGFKIQATANRWGGWFSNKTTYWRVLDPRGFELEIYSANLAFILDSVGVNPGGVIPGKCIWGRDSNGKNVLVPESSQTYTSSIKKMEEDAARTFVPLKDVSRGSIVKIDGAEYTYYGSIGLACIQLPRYHSGKPFTEYVVGSRYVLKNSKGKFEFKSQPKIEKVIAIVKGIVTAESIAYLLNTEVKKSGIDIKNMGKLIFAHESKSFLEKECTISEQLITLQGPDKKALFRYTEKGDRGYFDPTKKAWIRPYDLVIERSGELFKFDDCVPGHFSGHYFNDRNNICVTMVPIPFNSLTNSPNYFEYKYGYTSRYNMPKIVGDNDGVTGVSVCKVDAVVSQKLSDGSLIELARITPSAW